MLEGYVELALTLLIKYPLFHPIQTLEVPHHVGPGKFALLLLLLLLFGLSDDNDAAALLELVHLIFFLLQVGQHAHDLLLVVLGAHLLHQRFCAATTRCVRFFSSKCSSKFPLCVSSALLHLDLNASSILIVQCPSHTSAACSV